MNLSELVDFLAAKSDIYRKVILISDETVTALYAAKFAEENGFLLFTIPDGELSKTREQKARLEDLMMQASCGRDSIILAMGGGVVGDLAGFTAATYMRGIPFVQIPTTLLAMVDSSIGAKTGINTPYGKNLIGAFWEPLAIIREIDFLESLSLNHMRNGLVEAVKVFLTNDAAAFDFTWENLNSILQKDKRHLEKLVNFAADIKSAIVARDFRETNERQVLNLGHSIGHAIEKLSNYEVEHGYAVAAGTIIEARMSHLEGILPKQDLLRIEEIFTRIYEHLPKFTCSFEEILNVLPMDKKSKGGEAAYIALESIGSVHIENGNYARIIKKDILGMALSSL